MKKIKYLIMALVALMLFPIINGMGCDFNYKLITPGHEQFGSCKFGQYTLIDYPDPEQDNGYTVLKGMYFYAFGNAAILVTSNEDHTKKITDSAIESLNMVNKRFWHQLSIERLNKDELIMYGSHPKPKLQVIPYDGTLAMTDSES
ncbi:hypothetical protein [Photobacterium lucens]|uniref:hypothetical protein n=1 Tax=Photobacterium lucens TaxID=2562949 RepID=UPI0006B5F21C|nr:hypothetical protein [Photobacterium lucens]KPA52729.1 hypothetical protein VT25_13980 [Photobacterium leiognathi subsp. mandapamensis]MBP2699038.1 hypothetical protein [Vibrio parahaemolyticus]MZG57537.1 hypothetical protein [Photobacterium lucens]MZG80891.1 hypothetical protein [Photobacterium lucens]PSV23212.1 hypothetical protein C0W44_00020 [Photobacterium leiognathi subsp. mandapamensis]